MTATRCEMWRTRRRSCATKRIVSPSRCCSSSSRFTTCACTETSSAETSSSAIRHSGSTASARAMPIRCRCPPENSCGRRSAASAGSAHEIEQLGDAARDLGLRPHAVDGERLAEDLAHAHARVERAVGVLKDHLDAAVVAAELGPRQRADVQAVEANLAARRPRSAAPGSGRAWTCRSPIRRRCRASRRARRRSSRRSTHARSGQACRRAASPSSGACGNA